MTMLDIQRLAVERMKAGLPPLAELALPPQEWSEFMGNIGSLARHDRGRAPNFDGTWEPAPWDALGPKYYEVEVLTPAGMLRVRAVPA